MYGWIWRQLPGPTSLRVALAVLLIAVAVVFILFVLFPWLARALPYSDVDISPTFGVRQH